MPQLEAASLILLTERLNELTTEISAQCGELSHRKTLSSASQSKRTGDQHRALSGFVRRKIKSKINTSRMRIVCSRPFRSEDRPDFCYQSRSLSNIRPRAEQPIVVEMESFAVISCCQNL
jgi:hypothetical protein